MKQVSCIAALVVLALSTAALHAQAATPARPAGSIVGHPGWPTVDGYIERSGSRLTRDGFFERSIHNEIEQFGNIVQVWSTWIT